MGTTKRSGGLADALFWPVQQRVLALLFGQPNRRYQSSELIRLVGSGTGATHRVLRRLTSAGLVTVTRTGNQKHYQANKSSPVFAELRGLIVKTVGLVEPIRGALAPKADQIHAAFVYGSVAKGTDKAGSDIDVMIISDELSYADVYEPLQAAERVLARRINPNVMSRREWRSKRAEPDAFAARIAGGPRVFVIGSTEDIA
jgi:predicted nucleotidyltransferase